MGIFDSISDVVSDAVKDVETAITDPGELVKDAVDYVLPDCFDTFADAAGALVDLVTEDYTDAKKHATDALNDLPQLLAALDGQVTTGKGGDGESADPATSSASALTIASGQAGGATASSAVIQ